MDITRLFVSQRKLRRPEQIQALVQAVWDGDPIPRIRLVEAGDGMVQVDDGHHRVVAHWLAGRVRLHKYEYLLIQAEGARTRFGRVADLVGRMNLVAQAAEMLPVARETGKGTGPDPHQG